MQCSLVLWAWEQGHVQAMLTLVLFQPRHSLALAFVYLQYPTAALQKRSKGREDLWLNYQVHSLSRMLFTTDMCLYVHTNKISSKAHTHTVGLTTAHPNKIFFCIEPSKQNAGYARSNLLPW